jgi:putative serine protease PepD
VAAVVGPSVGMIIVSLKGGTALGSGFVVASTGGTSFMITNNHVVAGAQAISVLMLDGRHFEAQLQGTDPVGDIAVLKLPASLPPATIADSTKLRVGQQVVAIGSPLGNQGSVTSGIISAVHRTIAAGTSSTSAENLPDVIQTDAAINPGNSGGPLADAEGNVIGVNTAADRSASNIGFAIPSLIARRIAQDLIQGKKAGHPFLGISYATEDQAIAAGKAFNGYGVIVQTVEASSAADRAGIRAGDVIEKIDGVDLNNGETLGGLIQLHAPGDRIKITVLRGSSTQDLVATLTDGPPGQ